MNSKDIDRIVELDLRVSCEIFWKYEMKLCVNRDEFIESGDMNEINNGCCDHCKSPIFSRLERFLCDSMISYIHEDLAINGNDEKILKLCEISSKFHIHGQTTHSLLNNNNNLIYICSHC
jgi:hypothetical protein